MHEGPSRSKLWFPEAIDLRARTVRLCHAERDQLAAAPFLDERWDSSGLETRVVDLRELAPQPPAAAPRFIWHSAFCCSTLLARCLDAPGINLSLREPSVLEEVANIRRTQGAAAAEAWLRSLVPALARPAAGERCITIKPTNTVNNLIGTVARLYPEARHLCLTSDARSFLISIARKGEAGRAFARRLFTIFAMDGHAVARTDSRQLMKMSDLQIAALVWHMQVACMLDGMRRSGAEDRFASLDGDLFVRDPVTALTRVDDFFELGLGAAHIADTAGGPLFHRDAKDATRAFDPDLRADEAKRMAASLGPELEAIVEWSYGLFPDSPRDGMLPRALMP